MRGKFAGALLRLRQGLTTSGKDLDGVTLHTGQASEESSDSLSFGKSRGRHPCLA